MNFFSYFFKRTNTLDKTIEDLSNEVKFVRLTNSSLQRENEQFKLVIANGFLTNVVNNEVSGLISQNEIIRASALDKIKAAQYLKAYLDYVTDCGLAAKMELLEGVE